MLGFDNRTSELIAEFQKTITYLQNQAAAREKEIHDLRTRLAATPQLSAEQLREICALTVELTRLRQNECKHLSIENVAPDIFGKLFWQAVYLREK